MPLPFLRRGNRGGKCRTRTQTKAFRTKEPEGLVAAVVSVRNHQRAARIGAKLVLRKRRPLLLGFIQKEIIRVEDFVAQVFVASPCRPLVPDFVLKLITPPENLPQS